jgi:predicted metal-dependent phosphoesterase TrpH
MMTKQLNKADLHIHSNYSDGTASVEEILTHVAASDLRLIAITDHDRIAGAHKAKQLARSFGVEVIVGEEVSTAEGHLLALFIEQELAPGRPAAETIAAIHAQGGLAYVPHPFDRLHSVPDYEHLLKVIDDIDILEIFNARVAVPGFNEEARRFAAKYRVVAGAGSDSHVTQGLGTVKIRMRDFDGAEEFLESLRDADILHKRKSLIYLQSLKFVQTKVRPRRRTA